MASSSKKEEDIHTFIRKAYQIVENSPEEVCSWNPEGTSFYIKKPKEFASTIIPRYFNHSNLSSYVRQLNYWGFHKIKSDELLASGKSMLWLEFRHNFFLRGRPDQLAKIERENYQKKRKGAGSSSSSKGRGGSRSKSSSSPKTKELPLPSLEQEADATISALRSQVTGLEAQVSRLSVQLQTYQALEQTLAREEVLLREEAGFDDLVLTKKRRRSDSVDSSHSSHSSLSSLSAMGRLTLQDGQEAEHSFLPLSSIAEEEEDEFTRALQSTSDWGVPDYEHRPLVLSPTDFSSYVQALPLPLQELFLEKVAKAMAEQHAQREHSEDLREDLANTTTTTTTHHHHHQDINHAACLACEEQETGLREERERESFFGMSDEWPSFMREEEATSSSCSSCSSSLFCTHHPVLVET